MSWFLYLEFKQDSRVSVQKKYHRWNSFMAQFKKKSNYNQLIKSWNFQDVIHVISWLGFFVFVVCRWITKLCYNMEKNHETILHNTDLEHYVCVNAKHGTYFKLSKYYKFGKYILGKNEWSSWWMDHSFFQVYIDRKLKSQICNNFGNSSYQ